MKNPIIDGWYAAPEARVYNGKVYIYVTRSLPFEEQHNLDLIVSDDLIHFTKKESILDINTFKGATFAIWRRALWSKTADIILFLPLITFTRTVKTAGYILE